MLKYLWNRINKNEEGFTLVELLVVIVILGVLIGIGIPTYKGFTKRSHEAATKSELQAISTALKYLEIEAIPFDNIGALQRYLGDEDLEDEDLEGDNNKWTFLGKYELTLAKDVNADIVATPVDEVKEQRLIAHITKSEVITQDYVKEDK
ncbi:MAG: prepilin-type N-terminal cleavage/methylation domain-containing protein [Clostridiales bacterium]|nr:prepilin-type N-terminal cleavage/methylation domain-containing protein [Clostridiales bacterium]